MKELPVAVGIETAPHVATRTATRQWRRGPPVFILIPLAQPLQRCRPMRLSLLLPLFVTAPAWLGSCDSSPDAPTEQARAAVTSCGGQFRGEAQLFRMDVDEFEFEADPLSVEGAGLALEALRAELGCPEDSPLFAVQGEPACDRLQSGSHSKVCTVATGAGVYVLTDDFGQPENITFSHRLVRAESSAQFCGEQVLDGFASASKAFTVRSPRAGGLKDATEASLAKIVNRIADQYGCARDEPIRRIGESACQGLAGATICSVNTSDGFFVMSDAALGTVHVVYGVLD